MHPAPSLSEAPSSQSQVQSQDEAGPSNAPEPQPEDSTSGSSAQRQADSRSPKKSFPPAELPLQANPLRSLGDAMKEIKRRFNEILEAQPQLERRSGGSDPAPEEVEHIRPDNAMDDDMQALGPAGEEEAAKLNQLSLIDEQLEFNDDVNMDVDEDLAMQPQEKALKPPGVQRGDRLDHGLGDEYMEKDERSAILYDLSSQRREVDWAEAPAATEEPDPDIDDSEVRTKLADFHSMSASTSLPSEDKAADLWRSYISLTSSLASSLCESLRLILEPTLATRLKGDYRSGKRLNMKKIIPYIASDYTKDKIWLRRTRPSSREYQVLIALDDSKSMSGVGQGETVHLAYQTLALVTSALGKLEVGEVGILRFGHTTEVVHPFGDGPLTDQSGINVMKSFAFDQKSTSILSLVRKSLEVLEHARDRKSMSSGSSGDLWQLEIIISDAMCQPGEHEELKALLRKAEEKRVLMVFVVLDALSGSASSANSILTLTTAQEVWVNGRREIQLKRYLDTFPFPYYIVLRKVEALPDVLSEMLREFFGRLSGE